MADNRYFHRFLNKSSAKLKIILYDGWYLYNEIHKLVLTGPYMKFQQVEDLKQDMYGKNSSIRIVFIGEGMLWKYMNYEDMISRG